MSKRVAILTSGGDAPGMNACIRAAIIACQKAGYTLLGYKHGYNGLLQQEYISLSLDSTHNLIQQGGTILHSARCKEFMHEEGLFKEALLLFFQAPLYALLLPLCYLFLTRQKAKQLARHLRS